MNNFTAPKAEFTPSARNQFFGKLKPTCVAISQLAIRPAEDKAANAKRLLELTEELFSTLNDQVQYNASVLDDKIADYVFFPLSNILRKEPEYPIRLIEAVIKCLRLLIEHGWKWRVSKELSQQLLILFTFIIGGVPGEERRSGIPEETVLEGYRALTVLIKAAGKSAKDPPLTDAKIIPSLGHCISVTLEAVTDGQTPEIQLEALEALQALYSTLKVEEALATFLPGTVSSLARLLSPPASLKNQKRVLVRGLSVLKVVLTTVLGDIKTRSLQRQMQEIESGEGESDESGKVLTPSWLKATTAQVKIALAAVFKLRTHDGEDVQRALERLCIALLDECHSSLSNCNSILVETAMILSRKDSPTTFESINSQDTTSFATSLEDLAGIYPEITDTIKTTVYNWVISMPRVMQSSDERVKQQAIHNLLKGNEFVAAFRIDSTTLEDSLASALRDSIVALALNSKEAKVQDEVNLDESLWKNAELIQHNQQLQTYRPILLAQESQRMTRAEINKLIRDIGSPSQQTKLAAEMLGYVRDSDGIDQIASYWLSFELLKASFSRTSDVDSFLDLSSLARDPEDQESVFQELYSFSVSILASHSDAVDMDWRLEAITLEVTAFAASRLQSSFRPELIDVLYPIATFLGSQNPGLRSHAITTLNSVAVSCGYGSVSELIIDNVDYMVNSISLGLNTFDISPSSTKVLIMMIRLTGPNLIPYLDDVVAAIFAALDNYHGYPVFVESLFAVLSEIVDQGVKSDMLLLEGAPSRGLDHRKRPLETAKISDVVVLLDERAKKRKREQGEDVEEVIRNHPERPWKSAAEELNELEKRQKGEDNDEEPSSKAEPEAPTPPKTSTYAILTRVATLTQHYLTSPTPTLRRSLLELLSRVSPALAPDEDSFLPLVNAIWPVVVSRLHDQEPYVVVSACKALGALCESAGDFLSSRVKTEWWDGLGKWCLKTKNEARKTTSTAAALSGSVGRGGGGASPWAGNTRAVPGEQPGIVIPIRSAGGETSAQLVDAPRSTGLGRFAQAAQIWDAAVGMLVAIVSYVRIDDDVFDQILELLIDEIAPPRRSEAARAALEAVNADAVWLAMYKRGLAEWMPAPEMDGVGFVDMARGEGVAVL
ncbi:TEL2-interacting protein 1 [Pleurostoma richardsiae]|uniref:TEL2-interacting protein 1 n=1 Tax=Pleurostoma richardsiae TaxID=41990 RepID=A0AA38VYD0_9PEZI|nr:TEL2-interacting protein 1 [Pleurostoma richardsiae]